MSIHQKKNIAKHFISRSVPKWEPLFSYFLEQLIAGPSARTFIRDTAPTVPNDDDLFVCAEHLRCPDEFDNTNQPPFSGTQLRAETSRNNCYLLPVKTIPVVLVNEEPAPYGDTQFNKLSEAFSDFDSQFGDSQSFLDNMAPVRVFYETVEPEPSYDFLEVAEMEISTVLSDIQILKLLELHFPFSLSYPKLQSLFESVAEALCPNEADFSLEAHIKKYDVKSSHFHLLHQSVSAYFKFKNPGFKFQRRCYPPPSMFVQKKTKEFIEIFKFCHKHVVQMKSLRSKWVAFRVRNAIFETVVSGTPAYQCSWKYAVPDFSSSIQVVVRDLTSGRSVRLLDIIRNAGYFYSPTKGVVREIFEKLIEKSTPVVSRGSSVPFTYEKQSDRSGESSFLSFKEVSTLPKVSPHSEGIHDGCYRKEEVAKTVHPTVRIDCNFSCATPTVETETRNDNKQCDTSGGFTSEVTVKSEGMTSLRLD